jgi:hypothetical protein
MDGSDVPYTIKQSDMEATTEKRSKTILVAVG